MSTRAEYQWRRVTNLKQEPRNQYENTRKKHTCALSMFSDIFLKIASSADLSRCYPDVARAQNYETANRNDPWNIFDVYFI